ncbi:MAG: hypothetical protein RQ714_08705 [Nitrosomonas sp.]|nr:hypothetical protein [Nitrosomonas sp.]
MFFTISVRGKHLDDSILDYLRVHFPNFPLQEIDSVFGFLEKSTLYGGRNFTGPQLSPGDVEKLYSSGIGVRIPFTNHYVEEDEYKENLPLLEKYHREGNAAIITNDKLAQWIKRDFPKYRLEASVIKNIDTYQKIDEALSLYDTVVLPMWQCQEYDYLDKIVNKQCIRLFANAGCALTCPSKICYPSFSKMNKFNGAEYRCSQTLKDRQQMGMVDFDLDKLTELGFDRFKLLRARPKHLTKTGYETGY